MTLLYLPSWVEVLIALSRLPDAKRYPQRLYRDCPASISHTKTLLKTFQDYRLIRIDKSERIRWIVLTPQGQALAQHLLQSRWVISSLFKERGEAH